MKIDMTEGQFEVLLKMVYLGGWMAGLATDEPDKEFSNFEQYVLSLAKGFGFESYVGFDKDAHAYYPTEEFEEKTGVVDMIGDYNMHTVWEEVVLSLARRDLAAEYGDLAVSSMSEEESIEKEYPFILKYEEELRQNGFENFQIVKQDEDLIA